MSKNLIGIDIGGTKCAIVYGISHPDGITLIDKVKFPTTNVKETISRILSEVEKMMITHNLDTDNTAGIGIACGGPLDSKTGVIMSPPNLPGWDNIPIVELVEQKFGIRAFLQNDANACAIAEWKYGAGKGSRNMAFLTFGTGLGAGLIIDGKLYAGTNDNAGELGHIRLSEFGPVGYGKMGSFEGFASGNGIAQLARSYVCQSLQSGKTVSWCDAADMDHITALSVAQAAQKGDPLAKEIYETSARFLGKGLAILIDILNPEVIVIGGIYTRNHRLMAPEMMKILEAEALSNSLSVCKIIPAALGEQIGDYAAISLADSLTD